MQKKDLIRFDSPSLSGFIVSASWGDNDYADVSLRYRRSGNPFGSRGALSYMWDNTVDTPSAGSANFEALMGR